MGSMIPFFILEHIMTIMLFARKNLIKAFALSIPLVVFNLVNRPFEHLLNDIITKPSILTRQSSPVLSFYAILGRSKYKRNPNPLENYWIIFLTL
jgi:hypothetical protein